MSASWKNTARWLTVMASGREIHVEPAAGTAP